MVRCTAPVRGHSSASAAENCPACRGRSRGYNRYAYTPSYVSTYSSGSNISSPSPSKRTKKPRWASSSSSIYYTVEQIIALSPIRANVEKLSSRTDLRDVFLCHAWDDRKGAAKELHDLLESQGVSVWFSEKDVGLGEPLLRAIDKGLAKSRVGIVLVTPNLLKRLPQEGIADKELSALLAGERLVPIIHETTFEALREISPLLGSRSGLSTEEESMEDVATKLRELVLIE